MVVTAATEELLRVAVSVEEGETVMVEAVLGEVAAEATLAAEVTVA